jgi:ATP-binding cassette, subfamily B, bacterial
MAEKAYSPVRIVLRDYIRETWKHRLYAVPSLLLPGIGSTFVFYVPPLVIGTAIKNFDGKVPSDLSELIPYLLILAGGWLFGELCWHITLLLMSKYESRGSRGLYIYALDQLLKRDADFFNNNFAGSLTKRVINYSSSYERFFDTVTFNISGSLLPLLFAVVVLWLISPFLVVVLISILLTTVLVVRPLILKRMRLVRLREAASTKASGHVADVIGNMSAVQAFAREDLEHENHVAYVTKYSDAMYSAWHYDISHIHRFVAPLNVITNVLGLVIAILVSTDAATIAAIFVTFSYFANATRVMFEFNHIYRNLESALSSGAEFTELLEKAPAIVDVPGAKTLTVSDAKIELQDIEFAYPERKEDPLFEKLNLSIPSGQKVALVGHSGGGKTSITKLLLRFSDLDGGQILIDGQNIADVTMQSLRQSIAYVPQDAAMFHRSIMDNIRYGRLEATDAEVIEAAKKAHALEFIDKLPQGFETLVGERGVKLSGGQRQRIAIARAILKEAPILVLDEATSALDSESEKLIQASLRSLMKGRTSIVIAHRLSTISKLDRIVVLENGTIIEDGSHDELIKANKTYAKLWSHQSGGFIEE